MRPVRIVCGHFRKVARRADSGDFFAMAAEPLFPCGCCLESRFVRGLVDLVLRVGMVMCGVLGVAVIDVLKQH
jgi:hypothetical protein